MMCANSKMNILLFNTLVITWLIIFDLHKFSSIVFYYKNKKEINKRYWGKNKVDIDEFIALTVVANIGTIVLICKANNLI